MKRVILLTAMLALVCISHVVHANVLNMGPGLTSLETVIVDNPGNPGEMSGDGGWAGPTRICGQVNYTYKIGKYEVTSAQYSEFLNAVAKTDTYGLYNPAMANSLGCRIVRSGVSGSYVYTVASGNGNKPVNYVSWADSARFANWLHNGQGVANTVAQAYALTENGAYTLNGMMNNAELNTINRNLSWQWAVASEDEWHKAAYYDPNKGGIGIGGYWDFPMKSDRPTTPGTSFTGTNDANWKSDKPYPYSTNVGSFVNSPSAYSTLDQGGNVMERNDTLGLKPDGITLSRSVKGGSYWFDAEHHLYAVNRSFLNYSQEYEEHNTGFRVVTDPGPDEGEVQVDEHKILYVNGEPFLPIGYMGVSPADMEAIAQIGANTVHNYNAYYWTPEYAAQYMAEAARMNLKVTLPPWGSSEDSGRTTTTLAPEEITRLTNQVNFYKNHPNFLAWYMCDEPEGQGIPASRLREAYQLVKSLDPYHPCIMLNDTIAGIENYKDTADIMMPDPYCRPTTTGLSSDMSLVAGYMDQIGLVDPDSIAMACLQAFDYGEFRDNLYTDRAPTLEEFRSMTWIAVNHGCKGFINYAWPYTFNYPDLYLGVPYVLKEIKALSGVILSPNMRPVSEEGLSIGLDASVVECNGETWVIVVNILNQPRNFTLEIPELGNLQLNVVGEDVTAQASNGILTDTLQNYQTRIYTTGDPNFSLRKETVKASIAALEAAKRKPGNFAFWMDNGTIVSASSWSFGNRITSPRSVTNGVISEDEGWRDANTTFPDWIQLTWPESRMIGKVELYSHNLQNFEIQYLNNGNWITLKSYVGDSAHQLQTVITFPPVSAKNIRVLVHSAFESYSQISEIECYSEGNYTDPDIFNMGVGLTSLETVIVGNPGNIGETSGNAGWGGPIRLNTGQVDYFYKIGKYEVTAAQYAVFLNAVAKTDTYGLYNPLMNIDLGCRIIQNGVSGSYTYAVGNNLGNKPVNYVSWADCARFANWLHNGQGVANTVAQAYALTENGAYTLNGTMNNAVLNTINRNSNWQWAVASEDEWYKAAYYDFNKNGAGIPGYWDYPMQSEYGGVNPLPGTDLAGTNDANWKCDKPYNYSTDVGSFVNSPSAYGTFDQGGNRLERNDTLSFMLDGYTISRGVRGGSYWAGTGYEHQMIAENRAFIFYPQDYEEHNTGFRVAAAPTAPVLASLSGTVNLFDFGGDITTIPVTVELNGIPYNLNLDVNGNFTITDVAYGTYDVRIKASHWLARMTSGVTVAGDTIILPMSLINGDVVNNNEVDFSDINATRAAYGSFPGDEAWNEMADVDGSLEVDFADINIVRSNYGEIGE